MTMLGYLLGNLSVVRRNFEMVVVLIIFLSLLPTAIEVFRARRASAQ